MSNVSDEIIIQTSKFALNGEVPENNENGGGNTDDHNNSNNEDADAGIIKNNLWRDLIPLSHLFKDYIIRNVPVNPEPQKSQPGNLCKDEGKEDEKLGLMFLHKCNNKNKLYYISKIRE